MSAARILIALAAFLPLVASALLVAGHAVEVPVWDDLERATLLDAWQRDTLDWAYLYSPQIEHRIVVPRLITILNAKWFGGTLLFEQGVIFAVVALTALGVHLLLRRSFPESPAKLWGLTLLANLMLLSPMHWETFLWSVQTAFVVPPLALVWCLWLLGSQRHAAIKLAGCGILSLAATWSYTHGVALWAVVFAAALLQRSPAAPRTRALFLSAWAVLSLAVLIPHFTVDGFSNRSDHGYVGIGERVPGLQPSTLPDRAPRAARFAGGILGSPLARTTGSDVARIAPVVGAALGAVFAMLALYALARFRDPDFRERWLPWLALGGFAMVACLLAAVGRSAFNKWQFGLIPHYLGVSTYLLLATVVLTAFLIEDLAQRRPRWDAYLAPLPALGLGALIGFHLLQWPIGIQGMREWKSARLQARAAILFLDHFEPRHWRRIDGVPEVGKRLLHKLDDSGFLSPGILPEPDLSAFETGESLSALDAAVERVAAPGQSMVFRGHAWLPHAGRRADAVLVTMGDRVLAIGELQGFPLVAVAEADHIFNGVRLPGTEEASRWHAKLGALAEPQAVVLDFYALDAERMRIHPFATRIRIHPTPGGGHVAERLQRHPGQDTAAPPGGVY
jgi:hypothetical protein